VISRLRFLHVISTRTQHEILSNKQGERRKILLYVGNHYLHNGASSWLLKLWFSKIYIFLNAAEQRKNDDTITLFQILNHWFRKPRVLVNSIWWCAALSSHLWIGCKGIYLPVFLLWTTFSNAPTAIPDVDCRAATSSRSMYNNNRDPSSGNYETLKYTDLYSWYLPGYTWLQS